MLRRFRRPVLASLLMAATAWAGLLPPAHIHLAADDHDHHHPAAVEHSHWAAHHHLAGSELEDADDEGRALFVDHPARVSASHAQVTRPPAAIIALFTLPTAASVTVKGQRASGNAPRDGPPRGLSPLRAPPISPAL